MNKSCPWLILSCVALLLVGCTESTTSSKSDENTGSTTQSDVENLENAENELADGQNADSFFVVDHYDPERDAVKDLEMTTLLASKSGKRILIEVGGKW